MRIQVEEKIIDSIERYLKIHNIGMRSFENGNYNNQKVGLIGEIIVYKLLIGNYPNLRNRDDGFDGGFDFEYKNKLIDVKTMERKCYISPNFVNNFYCIQSQYKSDTIIFCSFNSVESVLEICGWITKDELFKKGIYYPKGTERIRTDGTSFNFRQDNYEIENKDLYSIETLINN